MNAPDPGADIGHSAGAAQGHDPPGQARLRELADEQAALRRVATLVAGDALPGLYLLLVMIFGLIFRGFAIEMAPQRPGADRTWTRLFGPGRSPPRWRRRPVRRAAGPPGGGPTGDRTGSRSPR
jgi:hypothetical protein